MSGLAEKFRELREKDEKAFVAYLTCGDGGAAVTVEAACRMADAGADVIELGVPFSDPVADGPVIQRACERALAGGMSLPRALDVAGEIRRRSDVPLVFFGYYNPVLAYEPEEFCRDARMRGADGLLVVDLPPEEAGELLPYIRENDLDMIFLLTPVSGPERIELALKAASGFLYFVSVTGVTGMRNELPPELREQVAAVKARTELPVCVGFGVSGPEMAKELSSFSDGVVVGSAIVKVMEASSDPPRAAADLVHSLKEAMSG